MRFIVLTSFLFLSALSFAQEEESSWSLKKDDDGIKVYTREIIIDSPAEEVSENQLSYRGIVSIKSDLNSFLNVMRDVPNFDQWLHNSYDPSIVEKIDNNTRVVYQRITAPWPTTDRDSVLLQSLEQAGNDYILTMESVDHDDAPESEDYVRVQYYSGFFFIKPLSTNELEVTYEAAFDSGGSVPGLVANLFIVDVPFYSLQNLRAYVEN